MAYRIFYNAYNMSLFGSEFLSNLKKAINGLYDRDKRLKINDENFWVIEKDILLRLDKHSNADLTSAVSHSILVNIPHTILYNIATFH